MKLILKKYYMPLILSVVSVLLIAFLRVIQNVPFETKEICVWISVVAGTILIRTIDDLLDYKNDLEEGKKVINIKAQWIIFGVLTLTMLVTSFISYPIFGSIFSVLYILITGYAHKSNSFLKLFICPILLMFTFIMLFDIYPLYPDQFVKTIVFTYIGTVIMISIVISIIFGFFKKGKR